MPTSKREANRPFTLMLPVVGEVTRLRSLRRVDFPAPFFPMMPSTSPCFTSKLMSRRALMCSPFWAFWVRSLTWPTLA